MKHIVALSGGKDSTAMALRLNEIEPRDYDYVITPTGDELPDMYEHWNHLSELLGQSLTVLSSGYSLQGLIRKWQALPNWRQRWCTRVLKIEPFNAYLSENRPAVAYVGLRYDEGEREGNTLYGGVEGITQRFPLREWQWGLEDVWAYLGEHDVIIPERTDCARCFFQRLGEWWKLWRDHPDLYEEAVGDEVLTGHTYRSDGRDKHSADLEGLRVEFERGYIPRGAAQMTMLDRNNMCVVCTL